MPKDTKDTSKLKCPPPPEGQAPESFAPPRDSRGEEVELVSRYLQIHLLVEVNRALVETTDGDLDLEPLLARLAERAQLRRAVLYRLNASEGLLHRIAASSGEPPPPELETFALEGAGLVPWVARHPQALKLSPGAGAPLPPRTHPGEYAVPLQLGSKVLGVLSVESAQPGGLRSVTRKLVEQVAAQLALALERFELRQTLRALEEDRARLQAQVFQMQRTETLGSLAGGIAHDFNNLLGVILGFASMLRLRLAPDDPLQGQIEMIEQSAERAATLARELLGLSRGDASPAGPVSVEEVVERVGHVAAETFDRRIQVETHVGADAGWVRADAPGLEQALLNLCLNARDAMPGGGTLRLAAARQDLGPEAAWRPAPCPPGPYVSIAVSDSGQGIEPAVRPRLFEPFFSTKGPGGGSGLGLSIVHSFVTQHGGFVHVESEPGCGSTFSLYLPAAAPPSFQPSRERARPLARGSGTVLVVDDEPLVLAFAAEGLKRLGYKVVTAENGERALETYAAHTGEIDYLIVDMVLPGSDGLEVCRRLREINPRARILLSSGYSAARLAHRARQAGASDFLAKPFTLEALGQALRKLVRP